MTVTVWYLQKDGPHALAVVRYQTKEAESALACWHIQKYTNTQTHKYKYTNTSTHIHKCVFTERWPTLWQLSVIRPRRLNQPWYADMYKSTQMHKYKYTNTKNTNIQMRIYKETAPLSGSGPFSDQGGWISLVLLYWRQINPIDTNMNTNTQIISSSTQIREAIN